MDNNRLCNKCGLLPQNGKKPEPCTCKPKCKKPCKKKCCGDGFAFRKVVIPSALGDDITGKDKPVNGAYTNSLVEYEANGAQYMYDSLGVFTKMEIKEVANDVEFNDVLNRPMYGGVEMTSSTNIPETTFRPFPESVVTNSTTQDFLDSIQALNAPAGMAYFGIVSLTDLPVGMIQEDVEVYVYEQNLVYCILRSTDIAPYTWWCASYNYQGWRAVAADAQTIFYADSTESGNSRHIYKNSDMTDAASAQDILDANDGGQVILRLSTAADPTLYNDSYLQNTYIGVGDYQFLFLDNRFYYEYDATNVGDTAFYYSRSEIQFKLAFDNTPTTGSNNPVTSNGIKSYVDANAIGETESYTVATADWSALSSSDPYDYSATVTATHTIGTNTICELINDDAVSFSNHGFAIGDVTGQAVTFYSIGAPSASVTLKVNYKG